MRLETERLLLRELQADDVEPELALWTDPDVMRFMGGPRDPARVRCILEEELLDPPAGPLGQWPVVDRSSGVFVGDCGLIAKHIEGCDEVELVYVIVRSAWGAGLATEIGSALLAFAFGQLGLPRVVSLIEPGNVASKHVAAKLGMRRERSVERPGGGVRELWAIAGGA